MSNRILIYTIAFAIMLISILISGCSREEGILEPEPYPTSADVFRDQFGPTVTYQAFADSKLDAVTMSSANVYSGSQALQIIVPNVGGDGFFAGGAFTAGTPRDLSGYNALTFYAKATKTATLNVVGIGNNNTGESIYTAEMSNLSLTEDWQKFIIPIPLPEKLIAEDGLFYFAEGPEDGLGYQIYMDEIVFESLGSITNPQPEIPTTLVDAEIGDTISVSGASVTFDVNGVSQTVSAMPAYFTFMSSNTDAVAIGNNGEIIAVGTGTATVTAKLGEDVASGAISIVVGEQQAVPTTSAPTPTISPTDVISLFSNAYTDVTVDTWSADWDDADVSDYMLGSDDIKKYENLSFAGIDFSSNTVSATGMTRFHIDVWTPNATGSAQLKIKLVDFGANGESDYPDVIDDVEHELVFTEHTSPGISSGQWFSIDVPFAAFSGLTTRGHLAQLIISGDLTTVYVDNIYFYDGGEPTEPDLPAPIPTVAESNVISLFSDAYTNETVNTWSAIWDNASVSDFSVDADNIKKYTSIVFAGIEFRSPTINAETMTHFHIDLWTPDPTNAPKVFKIKLVDFGADGVSGGDDNTEHEIILTSSVMSTGIWVSIDIPLSDFTGLTNRGHLAQLILSGDMPTMFVDNIYFYDSGVPQAPAESAPTPTDAPADVISIFSDEYTGTEFDTWSSQYDQADVADYALDSDNMKKYYNVTFTIAEYTTSGTVDISAMTHFHVDVWTPDPTISTSEFKIKLVDYGPNGIWDESGDDTEHELTYTNATMSTGSWISLDIPLTDFAGMTTNEHYAQLILSGTYGTFFIDNVYFHK